MKLETELNQIDRDLLAEATEGFVPERVFDFHAHVLHPDFYAPEFLSAALTGRIIDFADYHRGIRQLLPGRTLVGALLFPYTTRRNDRPGVNRWMFADLQAAAKGWSLVGLALVAPADDQGLVAEWLSAGQCVGLKPYHLFAHNGDTTQSDLEAYAPEWMWQLCDRHGAVLMLHLVKDAASLHPANRDALLRLATKYPRCQAVLAHAGRAFNHRTARGLAAFTGLPNVFVDNSVITEAEAVKIALDTLGVDRVLFGTDYPVSHFRGRCVTAGNSFQWIYAEEMRNPAMTLVGIESLRSLRYEAAEALPGLRAPRDRAISSSAKNAQRIHGLGALRRKARISPRTRAKRCGPRQSHLKTMPSQPVLPPSTKS